MSRYIEYEPLMAELERDVELADDWNTAHEIANVVKYAPTIDAVSVVRCKDCKHYSHYWLDDHEECLIGVFSATFDSKCEPNNFCCYGERKESE